MCRAPLFISAFCALILCHPSPGYGQAFLGKSLGRWIDDLKDKDPSVRRSGAFALGKLGDFAVTALPDLVRRVQDDADASVREMAASAIGDVLMGLRGGDRGTWTLAGPVLEKVLNSDADPRVKRSAAYALGAFGPQAGPACASLQKALRATNPDPAGRSKDQAAWAAVRQNAAWALGRLGEGVEASAVADLCEVLTDSDPLVRRDAASALGEIGLPKAQGAVKPLLALVKNERDEVVRKTALDKLVDLAGPDNRDAARDLEPILRDEDPETARLAAFVLAKIGGTEGAAALPLLRQALVDDDVRMQGLAAAGLARLGPAAAPAVIDLAKSLSESQDTAVRRNAALAIGRIGPDARAAVPELVKALDTANPPEVRLFAAEALANIKYPAIEKAIPTLLAIIKSDPDPRVRHRCVWGLFSLTDLERFKAVEPLTAVLSETADEAADVRYDSARVLAFNLRANTPDKAVDILLDMLNNPRLKVYKGTDASVSGIGTENRGGQSSVRANQIGDARYMAAEALAWVGDKAARRNDVVTALRKAAKDSDDRLSKAATRTLEVLGK
jgi:HEAT repeat protein